MARTTTAASLFAKAQRLRIRAQAIQDQASRVYTQAQLRLVEEANARLTKATGCTHPEEARVEGPRTPLRYGSAATVVCEVCGAYKMDRGLGEGFESWHAGPVPTERDEDDYA